MKIIPETCCVHYKIKYPHFYSSDNNMFNSVFHIFAHLMMGLKGVKVRGMVFNTTFNSISVISSFISGGNRSTWRKPQICCKSLTNCHIML